MTYYPTKLVWFCCRLNLVVATKMATRHLDFAIGVVARVVTEIAILLSFCECVITSPQWRIDNKGRHLRQRSKPFMVDFV